MRTLYYSFIKTLAKPASLLLPVLVFFSFLLSSNEAIASHCVGSDITYTCVPGQPYTYKVTFTFYRDCTGIPVCSGGCGAPCSRTLQIVGDDPTCSNQSFGSFNLNLVKVEDVNI